MARWVGAETAARIGAGGDRLLRHLEGAAAGDHGKTVPGIDAVLGERADQLVESVVPADILAYADDLAVGRAERRGMQRMGDAVQPLQGGQRVERAVDRLGRTRSSELSFGRSRSA